MICLSPKELVELTGRQRPSAQRRVLLALGVEPRTRPDGTLVVLRAELEAGGQVRRRKATGPDFDALDGALGKAG